MDKKFSPSEAAIAIFEFIKLHPKFVLKLCVINAIFGLLSMIILPYTGYYEFVRISMLLENQPENTELLMQAYNAFNWPVFLMFILAISMVTLSIAGMMLRKTVLNKEIGFFGLTFGNDEVQLLKAGLIIFLIYIAGVFVISFAGTIVSIMLPSNIGLAILMTSFVLFIVWLFGRLSQYGVLIVANGKFNLKENFAYTKETFWYYIGAYLLAIVIILIISIIVQFIFGAVFGINALNAALNNGDTAKLIEDMNSVKGIIYGLFSGMWGAIPQLAIVCVGAYAYHQRRAEINPTNNQSEII